jgi:hypothetical protein
MIKTKNQVIVTDLEDLEKSLQNAVRNGMETCLSDCRFGIEYKDEVWDRKTVADFFHITPEKISECFRRKEIPGYKMGREYFFLKSQIINLFKKGK